MNSPDKIVVSLQSEESNSSVSISDKARAAAALVEERENLFKQSAALLEQTNTHLQAMRAIGKKQAELTKRLTDLEDALAKLVK